MVVDGRARYEPNRGPKLGNAIARSLRPRRSHSHQAWGLGGEGSREWRFKYKNMAGTAGHHTKNRVTIRGKSGRRKDFTVSYLINTDTYAHQMPQRSLQLPKKNRQCRIYDPSFLSIDDVPYQKAPTTLIQCRIEAEIPFTSSDPKGRRRAP
jgi:hypothetical protein